MSTLTLPTVHLNGTSRDGLLEGYMEAIGALRRAVEALQNAAPNARDYYVQGPDAYARARTEHETRLHRIADNIHELNTIAEHVAFGAP